MANTKISSLPVANEIWNLDEVIPVVNSGNTTTSKRTYGSLFSNHSGGTYTITSTDQTYAIIACGSNSPQTHIRVGGINNAAVISSRGANISSGQMNTIIGSEQDSDSVQPHINGGQYNTIIGSKGNIETNGNYQLITNSTSSQIQGGENTTIMTSNNSQIGSGSYYNLIGASQSITHGTYVGGGYKVVSLGSASGNIEQATEAVILATRNFTSHLQGSNTMSMIASKSPTIEPVSNSAEVMTIINSKSSTLKPNQHNSMILNSDSVSIDDSTSSSTQISSIINGWGGGIIGDNLGSNYQKMLINTYGTQITHGGSRVVAFNANGGTISSTGDHNMLINTESVDITGSVNKATKVGVWNSSHTTTYENTLHTDSIHTYLGNSTTWRDGGNVSGSTTIDLSTGNLFSFTITGNLTSIQLNNARMGGEYEFFVYNSGSYTISTINLDGNPSTIFSSGGALNPTNSGYSFYRLRIVDDGLGGKRGVMKEYLNYSAI